MILSHKISVKEGKLSVSVRQEPGVSYTISFLGSKSDNATPEEFSTVDGPKASFELTDDLLFVRCRITSDKNKKIQLRIFYMKWHGRSQFWWANHSIKRASSFDM